MKPRSIHAVRRATLLLALPFAFVCSLAARVHAAGVADAPLAPDDRAAVSLSLTGSASPKNTAALIPVMAGSWRTRPLVLTLDAATSLTSYRFPQQERGSIQRFANPILGAQLLLLDQRELTLKTGLIAGAPLLTVPGGITNNVAAEHADRVAVAATGQRTYWMWARNVVPVAALGRVATRWFEPLELRVDLEPGVLVSVNRNSSYFALLTSLEAAVHIRTFTTGLRWTLLLTSRPLDLHDFAQNTAALFTRYEQKRLFGWAEFVAGIDGPQGIGARSATVWGATLGAGVRFGD